VRWISWIHPWIIQYDSRAQIIKKNNIKWPNDLKTPDFSKMIVLVLSWNKLENNKNVTRVSSPAEQTAFRIEHRSFTMTLKHFGMCVKNKHSSFYDSLQLVYVLLCKLSSRIILSPIICYNLMKNSLFKGLVCINNFEETQSLSKIVCKCWRNSSKSFLKQIFCLNGELIYYK